MPAHSHLKHTEQKSVSWIHIYKAYLQKILALLQLIFLACLSLHHSLHQADPTCFPHRQRQSFYSLGICQVLCREIRPSGLHLEMPFYSYYTSVLFFWWVFYYFINHSFGFTIYKQQLNISPWRSLKQSLSGDPTLSPKQWWRNRNTIGGAGVRGCEAADYLRETSACKGQKLGGLKPP